MSSGAEEVELDEEEVKIVAEALMADWFPNGHQGRHRKDLAEDYSNWLESADKDARIALKAIRKLDYGRGPSSTAKSGIDSQKP